MTICYYIYCCDKEAELSTLTLARGSDLGLYRLTAYVQGLPYVQIVSIRTWITIVVHVFTFLIGGAVPLAI